MRKLVITAVIAAGLAAGAAGFYAAQAPAPRPQAETDAAAPVPLSTFIPRSEPRPLPEIGFVDGQGRTMSLADFRGRVVLLNLWATWCGPCRTEMPTLDRLQARLGGPGFQVVPLSLDRTGAAAVRAFYGRLGLEDLPVYVDSSGEAASTLGAVGLPVTLLIDRKGREVGRVVGPADWDGGKMLALIRRHLERSSGSRQHQAKG